MKYKNVNYDRLASAIKHKLELEHNSRLCDHDCCNCFRCIYDTLAEIMFEITFKKVIEVWYNDKK